MHSLLYISRDRGKSRGCLEKPSRPTPPPPTHHSAADYVLQHIDDCDGSKVNTLIFGDIRWYLRITHISRWTLLLKYMHTYVCIDIFACILQYPVFMDITQVYFQLQLLLIQCLCELMFLLLFCMLTVMPLEPLD